MPKVKIKARRVSVPEANSSNRGGRPKRVRTIHRRGTIADVSAKQAERLVKQGLAERADNAQRDAEKAKAAKEAEKAARGNGNTDPAKGEAGKAGGGKDGDGKDAGKANSNG